MKVVAYLSEDSCTEPFRFANLTDGCLEGLKLMHTLEIISLLAVQNHSDSQLKLMVVLKVSN